MQLFPDDGAQVVSHRAPSGQDITPLENRRRVGDFPLAIRWVPSAMAAMDTWLL
jgi:hypothetical protein